jgi:hypothetical protein
MTARATSQAPNTHAALVISTAAIVDLLLPAALALTCARALRHRHAASHRTMPRYRAQ